MTSKIVQMDWIIEQKKRDGVELTPEDKDMEFKVYAAKSIRGLFARNNENEFAILELHKRLDKMSEVVYRNA